MSVIRRVKKITAISIACVSLLVVVQTINAADNYHKLMETRNFLAEVDLNSIEINVDANNGLQIAIKMRVTPKIIAKTLDNKTIKHSIESIRVLCNSRSIIVDRSELYDPSGKIFEIIAEPKILKDENDPGSLISHTLKTMCGKDLNREPLIEAEDLNFNSSREYTT